MNWEAIITGAISGGVIGLVGTVVGLWATRRKIDGEGLQAEALGEDAQNKAEFGAAASWRGEAELWHTRYKTEVKERERLDLAFDFICTAIYTDYPEVVRKARKIRRGETAPPA